MPVEVLLPSGAAGRVAEGRFGLPFEDVPRSAYLRGHLEEYRKRKRNGYSVKVAVPAIDGLGSDTGFNGCLYVRAVDTQNVLEGLIRREPEATETESTVQRIQWQEGHDGRGGKFVTDNFVIPNLQDPKIASDREGNLIVAGVEIDPNSATGNVDHYRAVLFFLPQDGEHNRAEPAYGPPHEKYAIPAYIGDEWVILTRHREDSNGVLTTWLRFGRTRTEKLSDLSKKLLQMKDDPTAKVEGLIPEGEEVWPGATQVVPLRALDGTLKLGILGHDGGYAQEAAEDNLRMRYYFAMAWEQDPQTGTFLSPQKVVLSSEDFPEGFDAKFPSVRGVLFPVSLTFVVNEEKHVVKTIMAGGYRDKYFFLAEIPYPFSDPPDPQLNTHCIIKESELPKDFLLLFQKAA